MKKTCLFIAALTVFVSLFTCFAAPVQLDVAEKAAMGWLRMNPAPMETPINGRVKSLTPYYDTTGQAIFFTVSLEPEGFIVLSADDNIEPVIAFSAKGSYVHADENPLTTLLEKDMQARLWGVRNTVQTQKRRNKDQQDAGVLKRTRAREKWLDLSQRGETESMEGEMGILGTGSVSDVRVEPFVLSQWDQGDVDGSACYNYYTPNNYVTGCVATAMAQLMRYHEWPVSGIGVNTFEITVDGSTQYRDTLGGDGAGGAYNWSQMPYVPSSGVSTTQRQAIGALNHDAGCSVNMAYTSSSSSASSYDASVQLVETFDYSNSIYSQGFSGSGDQQLWTMINTNMDAQLPVILSIRRTGGGHAVIVDGYGYNSSTPYHHINMGWGGSDNAWYQLPVIDAYYTYDTINGCVYNVYTSGGGEIVSGRVTDLGGAPLESATVTAFAGASQVMQTTTNERGIYSLAGLASGTQYRVSVQMAGYIFSDQYVTTGTSSDWNSYTGNKWGVDFAATNASPPTAYDVQADTHSTNAVTVSLSATDDNLPDPPGSITYIITSLPEHGELSVSPAETITSVPYALAGDSNEIQYRPCPYFGGADSFTYKADDGGAYPSGGQSNTATATVNVDNQLYADFGTGSNTYSTFLMKTAEFYAVRMQVIYLQSDIGEAKNLTDLEMNVYILPGTELKNWTIRMQHTDWNYFSSPSSMFPTTGWTTVYSSDVTLTETGWVKFHFDTHFAYNGTENLLVDFSYDNSSLASPAGGYFIENTGTDRFLALADTSGTHGDPLGWEIWETGGYYRDDSLPSIKLTGQVPIEPLTGDFNRSCKVNLPDFGIFAEAWQSEQGQAHYDSRCDISVPVDDIVDIADLAELTANWLAVYP